ncbi:MAG: hypothetical protein IPN17_15210 [Deltaproteobacteria bacterium]|nr:hypothetical protein [Deltaproteobacteria bacterium]MBK8693596.1 hypothetical protein [Deltaproteobacteria bacterium]MBP6831338.1 hypothetical protein [Deltaproteobacteria bacterium]
MPSSPPFTANRHVHLVGIGGIGVSAIAHALLDLGLTITGSDTRESRLTRELAARGARVTIGHDPQAIDGAEAVIYSSAIAPHDVELVAARARGIPTLHRAAALGRLLSSRPSSVGVLGTHGKGTVSAMVTAILERAGLAPSFVIGALLHDFGGRNARMSDSPWMVAEVDESDGSMADVAPACVVVNNLEADHLNFYEDLAHIQRAVAASIDRNDRDPVVVFNASCPGACATVARLQRPRRLVSVAASTPLNAAPVDYAVRDLQLRPEGAAFVLEHRGAPLGALELGVPGAYNVENAALAAATAHALGVEWSAITAALRSFGGLENRFTSLERAGRRLVKDYVSHPTAIRRVLSAAAADPRPLTAVFRPYRFTLLHYLHCDYSRAFDGAARVVLTEFDAGGEAPIDGVSLERLRSAIADAGPEALIVTPLGELEGWLMAHARDGQQLVFFGGDELFAIVDRYAETLAGGPGA